MTICIYVWETELGPNGLQMLVWKLYMDEEWPKAQEEFRDLTNYPTRSLILINEENGWEDATVLKVRGAFEGVQWLKDLWIREEQRKVRERAQAIFGDDPPYRLRQSDRP